MQRKFKRQSGFLLLELMFVLTIVSFLSVLALKGKVQDYAKERAKDVATDVSKYSEAVADYLSINLNEPAAVKTGMAWLKDSGTCPGGTATRAYLPCTFPDSLGLGLGVPSVTIDDTGSVSTADIDFGTVDTSLYVEPHFVAADIIHYANASLNENLDSYVTFVKEDPALPMTGAVKATVDMAVSNIYLRTDGQGVMTGPTKMQDSAIAAHDNWSLIATDSSGVYNSNPRSQVSSANLNDVYIRSKGVWASDMYDLAQDAYEVANQAKSQSNESVRFVTVASHGDTVLKPTCDVGLTPQLFITQSNVVTNTASPQALSGLEAWAIDNGADWTLQLKAFDASAGGGTGAWVNVTSNLGNATIIVKCST